MASRVTIETILRDDEDHSGQTIREWKIEAERGHVVIKLKHGDGFIMLRPDDVDAFVKDMRLAGSLAKQAE